MTKAGDWFKKAGDSIVNTATLGQCDGAGCGKGHTGKWPPLAAVFGDGKADPGDPNSLGLAPEDMKRLASYAVLGIGGYMIFTVLMKLI